MADTTLLQILADIADAEGAYETGALTAATTTLLTAANYPWKSSRASASDKSREGAEILISGSSASVAPNPNEIGAYDASAGTFTPGFTYTTKPNNTDTFHIYGAGLKRASMLRAINEALREMHYLEEVPLSLVVDADSEAATTVAWTATDATLSQVTSNVYRGSKSLRVLATAANGQAASTAISVDPANSGSYYVQARVRAASGTARLIAYDNTNGANIDTEDWVSPDWGTLGFTFSIPSTCYSLTILLRSVANTDDATWDDVICLPIGARELSLPSSVEHPNLVQGIVYDTANRLRADETVPRRVTYSNAFHDALSGDAQVKVRVWPRVSGPLWALVAKTYAELSADTDTTTCPRDWIAMEARWRLLENRVNSAPGTDRASTRAELTRIRRDRNALWAAYEPVAKPGWNLRDIPIVPRPL
jgi:hypothetical protein